jgi:predicted CopG family antitoxin
MATKNIGIREEVYEHLKAHKQGDESFSETIERLLEEAEGDWQTHFGFLDEEVGEEFADAVETERERLDGDLADRQREILDALGEDSNE